MRYYSSFRIHWKDETLFKNSGQSLLSHDMRVHIMFYFSNNPKRSSLMGLLLFAMWCSTGPDADELIHSIAPPIIQQVNSNISHLAAISRLIIRF